MNALLRQDCSMASRIEKHFFALILCKGYVEVLDGPGVRLDPSPSSTSICKQVT